MSIEQGPKGLPHTETPNQLPLTEVEKAVVNEPLNKKGRSRLRQAGTILGTSAGIYLAIAASPYIDEVSAFFRRLNDGNSPEGNTPPLVIPTEGTVFDATATRTPRPTRTATVSSSRTPTIAATETHEATVTPTNTETAFPSQTVTATMELTATPEFTATPESTAVPTIEYTPEQLDAIVETSLRSYNSNGGPDSDNPGITPLSEIYRYVEEHPDGYPLAYVDMQGIIIGPPSRQELIVNGKKFDVNMLQVLIEDVNGRHAVIPMPTIPEKVHMARMDGQIASSSRKSGPITDEEFYQVLSPRGESQGIQCEIMFLENNPEESWVRVPFDDVRRQFAAETEGYTTAMADWIQGVPGAVLPPHTSAAYQFYCP